MIRSSSWSDDIILTGTKIHEDLRLLYASAAALVYVPWFEGFGIPAAEAMRCGTPVILSNTTSLPEVGGEAAIYVNPGSIEEICSAMVNISKDENLRLSLSGKGQKESLKFTWDNTAECIWESIKKATGLS
jgi:glycosyltransferase involved in cell wall biosynthesis